MRLTEKIRISIYLVVFLVYIMIGSIDYFNKDSSIESILMPILGFFLVVILGFLKRFFVIPSMIEAMFITFIGSAIILGNVYHFYDYSLFDDYLHILSSLIIVLVAFSIFFFFDKGHSFWFLLLFVLSFSMFVLSVWEIMEFTVDSFGLNSQRYLFLDGTPKVGRMALADTMIDLITDFIASICGFTIGYLLLRRNFESIYLIKKKA